MTKEEYLETFPWIDPTKGYPSDELRPGVSRFKPIHLAVSVGASHKTLPYMQPMHSAHLEHVDGKDWELINVYYVGIINGVKYYWGGFVEGLGFFNVMFVADHTRALTPAEREAWSKVTLGMYGSHSGKLSYTLPSGVEA